MQAGLDLRLPSVDPGRVFGKSDHLLGFHRQLPTGWPEAPHAEADESALSGRTAAVTGLASVYLGVPLLTPDRIKVFKVDVLGLEMAIAWMRKVAGGELGEAPSPASPSPHRLAERGAGSGPRRAVFARAWRVVEVEPKGSAR